jgi:hypothetical protein
VKVSFFARYTSEQNQAHWKVPPGII